MNMIKIHLQIVINQGIRLGVISCMTMITQSIYVSGKEDTGPILSTTSLLYRLLTKQDFVNKTQWCFRIGFCSRMPKVFPY